MKNALISVRVLIALGAASLSLAGCRSHTDPPSSPARSPSPSPVVADVAPTPTVPSPSPTATPTTTPAVLTLSPADTTTAVATPAPPEDPRTSHLKVPAGFAIRAWADAVPGARSLTRGIQGTVFVGTRREGKVYALRDTSGDHEADAQYIVDHGRNVPNGVAFHNGSLYVAEISRLLRYDDIEAQLEDPPAPVVVTDTWPTSRSHGWKFIRIGPKGALHVPIGAPCNACTRTDARYASISRMNLDGSDSRVIAHGVRNTVGFDWHPVTGELWFTDNGRDNISSDPAINDDSPPDELNRLSEDGQHFGFPYCHGGTIKDPEFGHLRPCADFVPPVQRLGAHVAALGMRFYRGQMFPASYRNTVLIAEHGSWNRRKKNGYRVTQVVLDDPERPTRATAYRELVTGFLQPEDAVEGRPVDLMHLPDGSLLISDDYAGAIYRLSYHGGSD